MKKLLVATLLLLSGLMTACSPLMDNTPRPRHTRMTLDDYDIQPYYPPCEIVTEYSRMGGIMAQYRRCPPVQFICYAKSTGRPIQCPETTVEEIAEDAEHGLARIDKEECLLFEELNKNLQPGQPMYKPLDSNRYCGKAAKNKQSQPEQPKEVWKSIALNGNNQTHNQGNTYTESAPSKNEAIAKALAKCRQGEKAGNACQTWQTFSNLCLAFSSGDKNKQNFYYAGIGLTKAGSEDLSHKACQEKAENCRLAMPASCALPCDPTQSSCKIGEPMLDKN
ncbi:TPA: DUF4189 domain-containing protein [Pasteurella multocida]|nr:DUF4189 domain-containing protein [Pasteurella multocida]